MKYYAGRNVSTWRFMTGHEVYTINYHNSEIVETIAGKNVKITLVSDMNNERLNDFLRAMSESTAIKVMRSKHVKGDDDKWYDLTEVYTGANGFKKTEYASRMNIGHIEFTGEYDFDSFRISESDTQDEPEAKE